MPININKKLLAGVGIPLAIVGWAAFRPELLFINSRVNEAAPAVSSTGAEVLSEGTFTSFAHETTGRAQIIESAGKRFLRFTGFSTSNGPDVRVYLVKGTDSSKVDQNSIELGTLKGNIGDQNYTLPADVNLNQYQSATVWCKRFSVAFGGANLMMPHHSGATKVSQRGGRFSLAAYFAPIEVTAGKLTGNPSISGRAAIVEENGTRTLQLDIKKAPNQTLEAKLVKVESATLGSVNEALPSISLGLVKVGHSKTQISKEIDAWLYRSVIFIDPSTKKVIAFAHLRSAQEKQTLLSAI